MPKEAEIKSSSIPIFAVIFALIAFGINKFAFKPPVEVEAPEGFTFLDGRLFSNEMLMTKSKQLYLGGGSRLFSGATVYAAGVYVDESNVKSLKKNYKSDDVDALSENNSFFKAITDSKEKTLLLKIHRTVHTLKVASMISNDIKNKVDEGIVKEFSKQVLALAPTDRVFKDFEIYINCKGDSVTITNSFDDLETTEAFAGKGCCNAIFESYLGEDSIAKPAMEGVAKTFIEMN